MTENKPEHGQTQQPAAWFMGILAFLAWLVTAVLGLVEIYLGRQTLVRFLSKTNADVYTLTTIGHATVFVLAVLWIFYVVFAGERGLRRVGKKGGWKIFAIAGIVEVIILILYLVV